eukprot:NODE_7313_length_791_cov_30.606287_g6704_i0.p1 GENE.NODE_7313_length_791_cov_30.606287_g6704_i0~~NODE_7313_length_791_cov_30.606287_g6704_i0.p1  ORF type:complete len:174 (+),score=21.49 NODE_7313_length_791_cov_30.606287_g6704_i0:60-581(+)
MISSQISPRGTELRSVSPNKWVSNDGSESLIQDPGRYVYDFHSPDGRELIHEEREETPNHFVQSREYYSSSNPVDVASIKERIQQMRYEMESTLERTRRDIEESFANSGFRSPVWNSFDSIRNISDFSRLNSSRIPNSLEDHRISLERTLEEHRRLMDETFQRINAHRSRWMY